jgi:hypothetical protein
MVLVTPFFPEHIKIRLYLIIIIKSTVNHDYNYTYVDLRTVVQKVFISCSGKKNEHEYSLFWQKTRISEHDTNINTIPNPHLPQTSSVQKRYGLLYVVDVKRYKTGYITITRIQNKIQIQLELTGT